MTGRAALRATILLAGLLLARLALQLLIYREGFSALTADEFSRTVLAARWAGGSGFPWHGVWLPFHIYLLGLSLKIAPNLLSTPRLVTGILGGASILLMYLLAVRLFKSRAVGLASAFLLVVNPAHTWLSSTPLTEIPYFTLLLAAVWFSTSRRWMLSAACLALANGFRFEGWIVSGLFSLYCLGMLLHDWRCHTLTPRAAAQLAGAAALPWLFPAAWMAGNVIENGDMLAPLAAIQAYKAAWFPGVRSFLPYAQTLWRLDPFALLLGAAALAAFRVDRFYALVLTVPPLAFLLLHWGQQEPVANLVRYLAPYQFMFYPLEACLLVCGIRKLGKATKSTQVQGLLLVIILSGIAAVQIPAAFHYIQDPATAGLAAGQGLRALWQADPDLASRPALVERSYWQYLGVLVGANDLDRIYFDRPLDDRRQAHSILLAESGELQSCLAHYRIGVLVLRSPELKAIAETRLELARLQETDGYAFYRLAGRQDGAEVLPLPGCTLSSGSGD